MNQTPSHSYTKTSSELTQKLQSLKQLINTRGSPVLSDAASAGGLHRSNSLPATPNTTATTPLMRTLKFSGQENSALRRNDSFGRKSLGTMDAFAETAESSFAAAAEPQLLTEDLLMYHEHNQFLYSKVSELEHKVADFAARQRRLDEENTLLQAECDRLKRLYDDTSKQLERATKTHQTEHMLLTEERDQQRARVNVLEERLRSMERELEHRAVESEKQLQMVMQDMRDKNSKFSILEKEIEDLNVELRVSREEAQELLQMKQREEQQTQALVAEMERKQLEQEERLLQDQQEQKQEIQRLLAEIEALQQQHRKEMEDAEHGLHVFHEEIDEVAPKLLEMQQAKLLLEQENFEQRQQIIALEETNTQLTDRNNLLKATVDELKADAKTGVEERDRLRQIENELLAKLNDEKERFQEMQKKLFIEKRQIRQEVSETNHQMEQLRVQLESEQRMWLEKEQMLTADLLRTEKDNFALRQELARSSALITDSRKDLQETISQLHADNAELKSKLERVTADTQQKQASLHSEIDSLREQIAAQDVRQVEMREKGDQVVQQLLLAQDKIRQQLEELDTLRAQNGANERNLKEYRSLVERAKKETREEAQIELQAIQQRYDQLRSQYELVLQSRDDAQRHASKALEQQREQDIHYSTLSSKNMELQQQATQAEEELETIKSLLQESNTHANELQMQLDELQSKYDQQAQQMSQLQLQQLLAQQEHEQQQKMLQQQFEQQQQSLLAHVQQQVQQQQFEQQQQQQQQQQQRVVYQPAPRQQVAEATPEPVTAPAVAAAAPQKQTAQVQMQTDEREPEIRELILDDIDDYSDDEQEVIIESEEDEHVSNHADAGDHVASQIDELMMMPSSLPRAVRTFQVTPARKAPAPPVYPGRSLLDTALGVEQNQK